MSEIDGESPSRALRLALAELTGKHFILAGCEMNHLVCGDGERRRSLSLNVPKLNTKRGK